MFLLGNVRPVTVRVTIRTLVRMTSKQKLLQLAVAGYHGHTWYSDAIEPIQEACDEFMVDYRKFVNTLAVLSPQVSVGTNVRMTVGWWFFNIRPVVMRSVQVSFDRLKESGYTRSAIKGAKTGRFADALLGDPNAVVLDTHMGYALGVPANQLRNKGVQHEAERRIGWCAKTLGLSPRDTQAAIWTGQRGAAGYPYSAIDVPRAIEQAQRLTQ